MSSNIIGIRSCIGRAKMGYAWPICYRKQTILSINQDHSWAFDGLELDISYPNTFYLVNLCHLCHMLAPSGPIGEPFYYE